MPEPSVEGATGPNRSARTLTALLRGAIRLAWDAAPGTVTASFATQIAAAVGITAQLLIARWVLAGLLGEEREVLDLVPALVVLVVVTSALSLATIVQSTFTMVLSEAIERRATAQVIDVSTAIEPITYELPDFHDTIERARFSAGARPAMAVNGLADLVGAAVSSTGIAIVIITIDPLLVPLALLGGIPSWLANTLNSRRYYRFSREQTTDDRRRAYFLDALSNRDLAKELRIYGMEGELRRRHDDFHDRRVAKVRSLARSHRRVATMASAVGAIGLLIPLGYLFWSIDRARLDLAAAGTALFALLFLAQRFRGMVAGAGLLYEAALFIEDVAEFRRLRTTAGTPTPPNIAPLPPFDTLRVEGLRFTYPGSTVPALCGVDLRMRRGETVALVGENASGKTTLAKLLAGIYQPSDGTIRWDDVDVLSVPAPRLRRSVSVLFQDPARLHVSAHDNVALGDPTRLHDRARVEAAGRRAGADEVVAKLPEAWDQLLSRLFPGGVDLSGGQWQRIALARALFRDAPLLLMDEPSSALDARAEARLFERIREVVSGRTVLFISHRFSTVRQADRIYVLHHGRVVEEGLHDELMADGGRYAELYRLQASAYAPQS